MTSGFHVQMGWTGWRDVIPTLSAELRRELPRTSHGHIACYPFWFGVYLLLGLGGAR